MMVVFSFASLCFLSHTYVPPSPNGKANANSSPNRGGQAPPNTNHSGDPVKAAALPRSLHPIPRDFLEPDLPRGGQGQDDQHGEQGQGEALVSVPGLQVGRHTGQEEVTHWREGGRNRGRMSLWLSPSSQSPAPGPQLSIPGKGCHGHRQPCESKGMGQA